MDGSNEGGLVTNTFFHRSTRFLLHASGDRSINNDDPFETDPRQLDSRRPAYYDRSKGSAEGITSDPYRGLPYVMFKGTDYDIL